MGYMELSSSSCAEIGVPIDLRRVSQGISGVALKEFKPLVVYDGEQGIALEPMQRNRGNLELIWATPSYFTFLR